MKVSKRWIAAMAAVCLLCVTLCGTIGERQEDAPIEEPVKGYAEETPSKEETLRGEAATVDKDTDGVEDYIEELFGTGDDTADTDGDGVSDRIEIFELATDPLVADGDTDSDGDWLTNVEELALGTDPAKKDSDADGLTDSEETAYATDPLVYDSDADGVRDGYEAELGTDPCVPQDTFDVMCEASLATVVMTLGGEQVDSLCVEPTAFEELFPKDMPGCIGEAYDVTVDGAFENGVISFALPTAAVEPTVYYFSEATQTLEPIVTSLENGTASARVMTAGTYVLLDRVVYESAFAWEDSWGATSVHAGVEVVFVIDDSSSMKDADPMNERLKVTCDLIDRLPDNSRVGVVRFSNKATALTTMPTSDLEAAKTCLTTEYFVSDGTTMMYSGIQTALTLFDTMHEHTQKVMIVLSDGLPTDLVLRDEVTELVVQKGVKTYTVALGGERSSAVQTMREYAVAVGGEHYTAQTADELSIIYEDIGQLVDITTDTDGDGIPDFYEDHMVAFNGVKIPLDKTKADTDYDGLLDSEEVKVELVYSADGSHVYVKGLLLSDPTFRDTDGDGISDDNDEAPFNNTFTATLMSEYATSTTSFDMDYTWFLGDNTVYKPALSKVSSLFAAMAYEKSSMMISDAFGTRTASAEHLTDVLTYFGMENAQSYSLSEDYDDMHLSEVIVGYRNVSVDGQLCTVLAVVVRGTNATIEEWSSNCDIGDLLKDTAQDDWINTDNHKGFDIAANRIMMFVERYIEENGLYRDTLVYWVTGHSRGAGIANILGANLEKTGHTAFTYTFASPNSTLASDAASYNTIFNIINADDFVPCLPIKDWGYTCYGVTAEVSVRENYEKQWENFTGIFDYNSDGNNMDACVTALGGILTTGSDPRVDCYRYTCACHGDGSNDTITIKNTGMSESSRDKAIAKIPANARPVCIITTYDGGWVGGWDFEVCQSPAYFMQLLAAFMGGEIDAYRFAVELNIADRYENAKTALIAVGISGVAHPHYPETYCMLADVLTAEAFG